MKKPVILKSLLFFALIGMYSLIHAQAKPLRNAEIITSPVTKPFKVLTNGKQITIQSNQIMRSVIVWTSSGHRIVEQKDLNTTSHSFTVPTKENIVFLLIEFSDGKRYTEKMGVK